MKARSFIFAAVVVFLAGLSTSCSKNDIAEEEELILSIRKDEIHEEDVM